MSTTDPRPPILKKAWNEYESKVLDPVRAGEVQRKECRIAFYMGAMSLLDGVLRNLSSGEEPTEADVSILDSVKAELEEFTQTMLKGRV